MPDTDERAGSKQRWLVEIDKWDWALALHMFPDSTPEEAKPHGELMYVRGIDIRGRLGAPHAECGKSIGMSLSPTQLVYWSGPDALDEVGQLLKHDEPLNGMDYSATVLIPEDSLPGILTCLSSVWRYVHLWTVDPFPRASVFGAAFSRDVHENLKPWIRGKPIA